MTMNAAKEDLDLSLKKIVDEFKYSLASNVFITDIKSTLCNGTYFIAASYEFNTSVAYEGRYLQ